MKLHPFTMKILQKTNSNEQFLILHYLYLLMVTLCLNAYCGKLCCYSMCHSHDSVDCFHVYILVSKARTCILCFNSSQFKLFIDNIGNQFKMLQLNSILLVKIISVYRNDISSMDCFSESLFQICSL